jgi:hypothetical protein
MLNLRQRLLAAIGIATFVGASWGIVPAAQAAETVVLRYGIFRGSLPVQDLATFAETGQASKRLNHYLKLADQDPERFRRYLTDAVSTDPKTLNFLLASPAGDYLLDQFHRYLYVPDRDDDRELLRSALETSAASDGKISLVKVLQNYQAEEVHINVRRVVSTARQFASIQSRFGGILNGRLDEIFRAIKSL